MDNPNYKCPLCGSLLDRDHWIKITGQWSDYEKQRIEQKKLVEKYKKETEERDKKYKQDLLKAVKAASESSYQKGVLKEKSERERMRKYIIKQAKDQGLAQKKIKELTQQLEEGKTPQKAGFDFEDQIEKLLRETFTEDNIVPTGKKGDVIVEVKSNEEIIGKILIECKKTTVYSSQFIKEILKHQERVNADYMIIVTQAQKKGKSNFFTEENVVVIDPLGLIDIITIFRLSILEMFKLKLTKEAQKEKGEQILRYMQSGDFKRSMVDTIEKSHTAYQLMLTEIEDHKKSWIERFKIYQSIHNNTLSVRQAIGDIITGGHVELEKYEFPQLEEAINAK